MATLRKINRLNKFCGALGRGQGEGPPVCYDVKYMDCTVHGTGASKFPLLQQENLTFELLRAVKHIS
jgi:hypothetical protein